MFNCLMNYLVKFHANPPLDHHTMPVYTNFFDIKIESKFQGEPSSGFLTSSRTIQVHIAIKIKLVILI